MTNWIPNLDKSNVLPEPGVLALATRALAMMLSGVSDEGTILRDQIDSAEIVNCNSSPFGRIIEFAVPKNSQKTSSPNFHIGNIAGCAEHLEHGLDFLLVVRDGFVDYFEIDTFEEEWPLSLGNVELKFSDPTLNTESMSGDMA